MNNATKRFRAKTRGALRSWKLLIATAVFLVIAGAALTLF